MAFVVFKAETRITDLAERAYGSKLTAADRTRAVAAIERANPHLKELKKLEPGTLVLIPRLPGLAPAAEREDEEPVAAVARELSDALGDFRKTVESSLGAAKARLEEVENVVSSKELHKAVGGLPGGTEQLEQIAKATSERAEAHARTEAALGDVARAARELSELSERLR